MTKKIEEENKRNKARYNKSKIRQLYYQEHGRFTSIPKSILDETNNLVLKDLKHDISTFKNLTTF